MKAISSQLDPSHPFRHRSGDVSIDVESRLAIVRRSGKHDLEMIRDRTPGLQKAVRRAAELRLLRILSLAAGRRLREILKENKR